ncbi:MAG: DUF4404 family protein [Acidimicrobiales bacterium]
MTKQQSILVAVDPPSSLPDLTPVLALALAGGFKLDLVHAVGTTTPIVAAPEVELEADAAKTTLERQAESLADSATGSGADSAVDLETHVLIGPPVDVILATAQMLNSAMIVVVGHKHDVGSRTVLGSFTSALLKVADRPVLVLPAGAVAAQPGFVGAVDRLIELIDREEKATELAELRNAASAQLQEPASEQRSKHLGSRLIDALHKLETSHPTLTSAINDVSHHLSGMGI